VVTQKHTTDLVSKLQSLRQLVDGSVDNRLATRIADELQKLQANRFHLVVLGQFKRGKTTFINALLGEELLPVGVVPVTSVVTLLRYGTERGCTVVFSDNRRIRVSPAEVKEYVTEHGNPENRRCVRYVEITHPFKFLEDGIVLVDTPGIGSLYIHNTATTLDFIPRVDAAIVVLSADLPITQTEYQFLDEVATHVDKLFFILNKIDLLTPSEAEDAISYTRKVLAEKLMDERVSIIPLSARDALLGETLGDREMVAKSNLELFQQRLETFVRGEKEAILIQRSQERTDNLIAEALFAAELQLKAVTTPSTNLQATMKEFEKQIELIKAERENFGYLLQGQIAALTRWIEGQLEQFATHEIKKLKDILIDWAEHHGTLSAREFQKAIQSTLASTLIDNFEVWRMENDKRFVDKYEAIISTYVAKTNEFIHRVLQLSADLFHLQIQPFENVQPMEWKGTFYYKVADDILFLEFDAIKVGAALLPRSMIQKHILRRALTDIVDKVTRHSGRLRYEYEYSIQESFRSFQCDLNEMIDAVVNQIHNTLQAAMKLRLEHEVTISSHVESLEGRIDQLRSLQT
jgi:ribosome biogenesis GTPase A